MVEKKTSVLFVTSIWIKDAIIAMISMSKQPVKGGRCQSRSFNHFNSLARCRTIKTPPKTDMHNLPARYLSETTLRETCEETGSISHRKHSRKEPHTQYDTNTQDGH